MLSEGGVIDPRVLILRGALSAGNGGSAESHPEHAGDSHPLLFDAQQTFFHLLAGLGGASGSTLPCAGCAHVEARKPDAALEPTTE
jgi:hypothetical protein